MKKQENKTNLLKQIFSKETFEKESEKDERIIYERNKAMYVAMQTLITVLVVLGILADTFNFKLESHHLFIVIGIINYAILLYFCKKCIVNNPPAHTSFIWSIITLPLSINNAFLDKIVTGKTFVIVLPISIILIAILLYETANIIYKKSIK